MGAKGQNKYKEYASRLSNNGKRNQKKKKSKFQICIYLYTAGPVSFSTAASSAQPGRCKLQARELGKGVNNC